MDSANAHTLDQTLAGQIFTSTEIRANFETLCDDMGSRFAGTAEEEEAAQFLEKKLREYGLSDVCREPFEYPGWTRGVARLTVTSPRPKELECLSLPLSPAGRARGRVVDLDAGSPETFEARTAELDGNIALVTNLNPTSAERWIHRTEKYNRSVLAGARAFIFMATTEAMGPMTGTLGFGKWGQIPGIMVSRETGLLLRRLSQRPEPLEIEVVTTDTQAVKTSWNIIGDVKPVSPASEEMILIGNHYDGHDIGQGAEDPASGLVAALEVARVLPRLAAQLQRTVRFVLFGVEELGLMGAHAYVNGHPEEIAATRLMINMDASGGQAPLGLMIYGPDTTDYFRALFTEMGEDLPVDRETSPLREPEHLSADHYPFMATGVPCAFIRDPEMSLTKDFYHSAHDTVDKVRAIDVKESAFLSARIAWRVANESRWPGMRLTADEVAKWRASHELSEVRRIEEQIEQLRAGRS